MKKATSILFILATLTLAPVHLAHAQKQATTPRIGVLYLGSPPNANLDAFIQGLRELGYVEGKNILISTASRRERQIVFLNSQGNWSN